MNLPKFFPLVIEIVIDTDCKQSFIIRHTNGNVLAILEQYSDIVAFLDNLCKDLVAPTVPSQVSGVMPGNSSVEKIKKPVRAE